ncbi:diacylglycerol/lipid kinase family protein [Frigidibacter sp. MR17.24]|uniref:diacylglycerol/lipid kinase family protein n=1 Tax=Frigidibacter sp. MR17.24 TaxID=3127345 RepID=UPI0030129CD3
MEGPICIIANTGSGKKKAAKLDGLLAPVLDRLGGKVEIRTIRDPRKLTAETERARKDGFRAILAAGGDGTVCAVASQLVGHDTAMGVVPMGTFNYFSRSLGFPQEPVAAMEALTGSKPKRISVGEVNGQLFLNNASLGLYAAILENREAVYGRWGRSRVAAYWSVVSTIARFRRPSLMKVTIDGRTRRLRTPMVFVAANGYQLDEFKLPGREFLDEGKFAVFLAPDGSRWQLVKFAIKLAMGRAMPGQDFEMLGGSEIVIETRRRRRTIARDGERDRMTAPFRFRMLTGALNVLAPDEAVEAHAGVSNRIAVEPGAGGAVAPEALDDRRREGSAA